MEKNDFKVFIKEKLLENLNIVKVFQREIIETIEELGKNKATIMSLKGQKPDLSVDDIRPILIDSQMKDYEIGLKEMDMKSNYIRPLIEYKTMADLFNVDLDLSEPDTKFLAVVIEQQNPMFVVDKNKTAAKDLDAHLKFLEKVRTKFSDDRMLTFALNMLLDGGKEEGTKEDKKD